MTAKRRGRQTGKQSTLLEQSVEALHLLGFQVYSSYGEFQKAHVVNERYIIRNYPHESLYGTPGRKEALLVSPAPPGFVADDDGRALIVVEAKYQDSKGSVDEKLPYIWEAFLASDVPNWIVILDGRFWKSDTRAKAATAWLVDHTVPVDRSFRVLDRIGFIRLAKEAWGAAA